MSVTYQQSHDTSIRVTIKNPTKELLLSIGSRVPDIIKQKPKVQNIVLKIEDALPSPLHDLLIRSGFRKQNEGYYVYPIKTIPVGSCEMFLEITGNNIDEYLNLLPAISDLCPSYLKEQDLPFMVGETDILFVLLNGSGLPCAVGLTDWSDPETVDLDYLCALVRGAGRKLFEHILEFSCTKRAYLKLKPANDDLRKVYEAWMGKNYIGTHTDKYMFMNTCRA